MDCSRFHADLVELLASNDAPPERLAALRAHAQSCPECAASRELVEWSALPEDRRGTELAGPEPEPSYWDDFNPRVHRRIEQHRRKRRRRAVALVAAAALTGVALAAVWRFVPRPETEVAGHLPDAETHGPIPDDVVVADLDGLEGVLEAYDGWEGFDLDADPEIATGDEGALFPAIDDLDAEERSRLLEWLDEQESAPEGGSV